MIRMMNTFNYWYIAEFETCLGGVGKETRYGWGHWKHSLKSICGVGRKGAASEVRRCSGGLPCWDVVRRRWQSVHTALHCWGKRWCFQEWHLQLQRKYGGLHLCSCRCTLGSRDQCLLREAGTLSTPFHSHQPLLCFWNSRKGIRENWKICCDCEKNERIWEGIYIVWDRGVC